MPTAIELVIEERQRQIETEGWTTEHDDKYIGGQLAQAAACYLIGRPFQYLNIGDVGRKPRLTLAWPWAAVWWKPSPDDRKRDIIKAMALGLAELERIQRQEQRDAALVGARSGRHE